MDSNDQIGQNENAIASSPDVHQTGDKGTGASEHESSGQCSEVGDVQHSSSAESLSSGGALGTSQEKVRFGLETDLDRSCRYHARRRGFFDTMHKLVMAVVLLGSSSALVFLDNQTLTVVAALLAALAAALDLVVGFSHRARDHEMLYRQFMALYKDLEVAPPFSSENDFHGWQRKRLEIETNEPPVYRALDVSCYNEVAISRGLSERGLLKPYHRVFMHFLRFSGESFSPV